MELTKDQQWETVVDALAVALVVIGEPELHGRNADIELSFSGAWRAWPQHPDYPSINPRDFHIYAMKSPRRVGAHGAFEWKSSLNASLVGGTSGWEPEEVLSLVAEFSGTSSAAWEGLARGFPERVRGLTRPAPSRLAILPRRVWSCAGEGSGCRRPH